MTLDRRFHQQAFSLIEMIASLLLTSLILLALLQIATSTRLSDRALSETKNQQSDKEHRFKLITDVIREDLLQAAHIHTTEVSRGYFRITTSRSLNDKRNLSQTDSQVTYRTVEIDGQSYLIRDQHPLITDSLVIHGNLQRLKQSEYLAADILSVTLREQTAQTLKPLAKRHPKKSQAAPRQYQLTFEYLGANKRESYTRHILLP